MNADKHIEEFGILLEDVLISRDKAIKSNSISLVNDYKCIKCGNTSLEKFYASNSDKCWRELCGVGGECIFCNRCMDIVGFYKTVMS